MRLRIKDLRQDNDKTQQELADILCISQSNYSDYENGVTNVPVISLITLAVFYDTSIDYIVGLTDEPKPYKRSTEYE